MKNYNYLMIFLFLICLLSFGKTKDLICFIVMASLISFGSLPRATDAKIGPTLVMILPQNLPPLSFIKDVSFSS